MPLVLAQSPQEPKQFASVEEQSNTVVRKRRIVSRLFSCPYTRSKQKLPEANPLSSETIKIKPSRTVGTLKKKLSDPNNILARLVIDVEEHDNADSIGYEISFLSENTSRVTKVINNRKTIERTIKEEETSLINLLSTASFYFKSGRNSFEAGFLQEALYYQNASLEVLISSAMRDNRAVLSSKVVQETLKLEQARVYYEIAQTELAILDEECKDHHSYANRRRAEARSKLYQAAVRYYSEELRLSKQKTDTNDSLDRRMKISQLLHILGRLHDEKIGDYNEALRCYTEALTIEESVLIELNTYTAGEDRPRLEQIHPISTKCSSDHALKRDALEIRIEESRAKIGNLHYKMGDFVSAMKVTTFCAATLCAYD